MDLLTYVSGLAVTIGSLETSTFSKAKDCSAISGPTPVLFLTGIMGVSQGNAVTCHELLNRSDIDSQYLGASMAVTKYN